MGNNNFKNFVDFEKTKNPKIVESSETGYKVEGNENKKNN